MEIKNTRLLVDPILPLEHKNQIDTEMVDVNFQLQQCKQTS
jgi:hypothetical protein